ncbi:hypothetical protein CLV58_109193 [Spirosoma oryzae]|uniref:Uncharacterized protein n=1 Tax=Spirosoma oryzae TaxID=1469603 RepID=A0A2T0SYH8_9BACT|nr:hypothetical protein [Spirosoma oryzae]PRY38466.1 hypothetical protein CLV58_109193 [Spirosoma oryzae]
MIQIFTTAHCYPNPGGPIHTAYTVRENNLLVDSKVNLIDIADSTNIIGGFLAVKDGLQWLSDHQPADKKIQVFTDQQFIRKYLEWGYTEQVEKLYQRYSNETLELRYALKREQGYTIQLHWINGQENEEVKSILADYRRVHVLH